MKMPFEDLLGDRLIDSYNYSQSYDREKMNYYQNHISTKLEKEKEESLRNRMIEFETKVRGKENIDLLLNHPFHPEWRIKYFENKGYISSINADRDIVDIYYYGRTENEAFINAIVSYELTLTETYELLNRKKLNKEFSERFLDGKVKENDYHGPFFFSELALQDFRKYYGDNIPEYLIKNYENHVNSLYDTEYKYDLETNRFITNTKTKQMTR